MGIEMLTESLIKDHLTDGVISPQQLNVLFHTLDTVGVSALWVDKDFKTFRYNKSNQMIDDCVKASGKDDLLYTELMKEIYTVHKSKHQDDIPELSAANWITKLRHQQETLMVPQEDYVALSMTGERFISRRVFLNDGSMLVISFDYLELQNRDDLVKIAFKISKSGILCYNIASNDFLIESPYLERILTPKEYKEVHTRGLYAIVPPEEMEAARDIFKRALYTSIAVTKTIRVITEKNGVLWFKFKGEAQKNSKSDTRQLIITFEDVTEELKVQENLSQRIKDSDAELRERLDFMAKLSHELKTPMNAIVGISDALIHKKDTPEDIKSKLELIQLSSEHLVNMLDDTLAHAKLRSENTTLNLQYTDPVKVVGDICKLWEHQALKKGTQITFQADPNLPKSVKMDAARIGQCLNNLISNATKFTEFGQIDVIIKPYIKANHSAQLAIAVRDNGIGMTDEQKSRIFEAYKQADATISSRFGGTGLGMSITKDLVELMGGKINVKSVPNKGSLFLILLPLDIETSTKTSPPAIEDITPSQLSPSQETKSAAIAKAHTDTQAEEPLQNKLEVTENTSEVNHKSDYSKDFDEATPAPTSFETHTSPQAEEALQDKGEATETASEADHTHDFTDETYKKSPAQNLISQSSINASDLEKLNILVVDDNETNHIVMSSLLEGVVSKIYSAFDGQQALDVLSVEHIDVVLMDIHMPVMDGIEATLAIRENPDLYPEVRIIALTADPQYQQKRLCVNIGMDEAIAKPVKLVKLIETIKKTLANPINRLAKAS